MKVNSISRKYPLGLVGVLILCLNNSEALIGRGPCPTVTPAANPTPNDPFVSVTNPATWFEVRRLPDENERGMRCVTWTFTATAVGSGVYSVDISGKKIPTRATQTASGILTQRAGVTALNQFTSTIQRTGLSNGRPSMGSPPIIVLGFSNADGWVVLYSCRAVGRINIRSAWLLTSAQTPTGTDLINALSTLSKNGIPVNKMVTVDQSC